MPEPALIGSYRPGDVSLLLSDLTGVGGIEPGRSGAEPRLAEPAHRLPLPEYQPSAAYLDLVRALIACSAGRVALLCATLAELMRRRRGPGLVIVSIARAGTPAGVLARRWLRYRHGQEVPHYSVSIANGAADANAIGWLCRRHNPASLQFLDAWTSKGTVTTALRSAISEFGIAGLDPSLAVLSDTASCTDLFAAREDMLLPHACLGATMSGLLSRTFVNPRPTAEDDFHAVVSYGELAKNDFSNMYLDTISSRYPAIRDQVPFAVERACRSPLPDGRGLRAACSLARRYGAADFDLVNIGTSESTRAFFRRIPVLLLVHPRAGERVAHLLHLADERNVAVRWEPALPFGAALL